MRDADRPVRQLGHLRGRQPVEVHQRVRPVLGPHRADDAPGQVQVAAAVLEADDARVAGQLRHGLWGEHRVVPLVDDHVEAGPVGQPLVVREQPGLAAVGEVRRHREQPIGTRLGGRVGERAGQRRAVPDAGDDRYPAVGHLDGHLDRGGVLVDAEREELAGTAAREDRRRPGVEPGVQVPPVRVEVHLAVRPEREGGHQKITCAIDSVFLDELRRPDDIPKALGHFLPVHRKETVRVDLFGDLDPRGHFVPAVGFEVFPAGFQRVGEMEAGDRAAASLAVAVRQRDHDSGTMEAIDDARGHDADHAGVPAFRA